MIFFSKAGNIIKMSHFDNLRKKKRRGVMACSSHVAYDKCKRSRVDGAIRKASVLLLMHVHTYTSMRTWQRERDINEARPATCEETARRHVNGFGSGLGGSRSFGFFAQPFPRSRVA